MKKEPPLDAEDVRIFCALCKKYGLMHRHFHDLLKTGLLTALIRAAAGEKIEDADLNQYLFSLGLPALLHEVDVDYNEPVRSILMRMRGIRHDPTVWQKCYPRGGVGKRTIACSLRKFHRDLSIGEIRRRTNAKRKQRSATIKEFLNFGNRYHNLIEHYDILCAGSLIRHNGVVKIAVFRIPAVVKVVDFIPVTEISQLRDPRFLLVQTR